MEEKLKSIFEKLKNKNMSLDELLYAVYDEVKDEYNKPFDVLRNEILEPGETGYTMVLQKGE